MISRCKDLIHKTSTNLLFRIDTTKYLFDRPTFDYQPLPWIGIRAAGVRGEATINKWRDIREHISSKSKSLKDIGCCVGFLCISAGTEFGLDTFGFDSNPKFLRIARYAASKAPNANCNFINLSIDEKRVTLLPQTDVTLCLSIWHHWVFEYGLDTATRMLSKIWDLTDNTLFFESGEEETTEEFKLPFDNSKPAREWLLYYLSKTCKGSEVSIIGQHPAGSYAHYKIKDHKRSLYKVARIKNNNWDL